jgi:very-long-chain (3R)-3-hydroxyacyl-CoA dehydratase
MDSKRKSTTEKQQSSSLSPLATVYLLVYNSILTVGWAFILYETVKRAAACKSSNNLSKLFDLWKTIEMPLKICQTAAFLEVFHAMFGLVRSNPMIVLIQIISRVLIVWGVANYIPPAQHSIGILLAVTAWSITEVIRYVYYALNLFQASPRLLTWCRYSFFIVLYPLGVTGELLTIKTGMETIYPEAIRNRYSILLPNKFNFGLDYFYFLVVVLLGYTYFPTLYQHMWTQRAKTFNTSSSKKHQ